MDYYHYLFRAWEILIDHGIPLAALLILAILLPRGGRLMIRLLTRNLDEREESTKASLALLGALVYVLQAIGYFVIIMLALTNLGVPPMGAAIPATVVSAAVGFGAQSVIGDFLSGFFIISERQFGVGDYVSFDGTSQGVEGTVVGLTLRATKVRTPSGEVVTIPNGSAGVITNFSQEWSRAVVDLQIPLRPGETMKDLNTAVEKATRAALRDESIRHDITGDLDIWPAMSIMAPSTAGQPWTVTTRVNVEVNPARQWAVERVIRAALLNTFWTRYEQSPTLLNPSTGSDAPNSTAGLKQTTDVNVDNATAGLGQIADTTMDSGPGTPAFSDPDATVTADKEASTADAPTDSTTSPETTPFPPVATLTPASDGSSDGDENAKTQPHPQHTTTAGASHAAENSVSTSVSTEEKVQDALSVGGRVRVSTTVLLIALFILGTLALFSSNPEDGNAGILSPQRWKTSATASNHSTTAPTPTNTNTGAETSQEPSLTDDQSTAEPSISDSADRPSTGTPAKNTTTNNNQPTNARPTDNTNVPRNGTASDGNTADNRAPDSDANSDAQTGQPQPTNADSQPIATQPPTTD